MYGFFDAGQMKSFTSAKPGSVFRSYKVCGRSEWFSEYINSSPQMSCIFPAHSSVAAMPGGPFVDDARVGVDLGLAGFCAQPPFRMIAASKVQCVKCIASLYCIDG